MAGWSKSCRGGSFLSTDAQRPRCERVLNQLEYDEVSCRASTCLVRGRGKSRGRSRSRGRGRVRGSG